LPRKILEYRSLAKLKGTYTDKLPELINPHTGRVHTSFHQAVAATGRLSSSDPNLQNIPIRTPEGRRIRTAFVAPPGWMILAADYSQIELRIMAHLSADAGPAGAPSAMGQDIHRATAAEVFGKAPDEVTSNERRAAKAINFGLIYGMSAFGLGKQLGIGRGQAQDYVDLYFSRYPGRAPVHGIDPAHQAREQGYVETVFGRRLYLPEIRSKSFAARRRRTRRDQRADAGHRGRHHQARDDRTGPLARPAHGRDPHAAAGARRTGVRDPRRPHRPLPRRYRPAHVRRRRTRRPAGGGCGDRGELG
jgi:DNA polymerase-1